ncbi:MAG TPA: hypothetical protein DCO72_10870 [Ruminococcus sp.]|nr:hypothetical protein [Ruminococcus sp.]
MIDKQRVHMLLSRYIGIRECSPNGMYPDPEGDFWIPMTEELTKNEDETIALLNELEPKEFLYTLEVLEDITEKLKSKKLLDTVRKIGIKNGIYNDYKKGIYKDYLDNRIRAATFYLD